MLYVCIFSFWNSRSWSQFWLAVQLQTTSPSYFHFQSWPQLKCLLRLKYTYKLCMCFWEDNDTEDYLSDILKTHSTCAVTAAEWMHSGGNAALPKINKIRNQPEIFLGSFPRSKPKWEWTVAKKHPEMNVTHPVCEVTDSKLWPKLKTENANQKMYIPEVQKLEQR